MLNNLSEEQGKEFLQDLKSRDEQQYHDFRVWQKDYFKRKDYKRVVEKVTGIERKSYELYLKNQFKQSYEGYLSILEKAADFKKRDWIKSFRWYDEILFKYLSDFSGDHQGFFTNLFRITDDNYQIWVDKANFFADNELSENAVECCRKLLNFNPKDVSVLKLIAKESYKLENYDESLRYFDEVLEIESDEYVISDKISALMKLDRTPEAYEYYKSLGYHMGSPSCHNDLIAELERIERFDYLFDYHYAMFNEYPGDYYHIDEIKRIFNSYDVDEKPEYPKEYYMDWIDSIKYLNDGKYCPNCGKELLKMLFVAHDDKNLNRIIGDKIFFPWGYNHDFYHHLCCFCRDCNEVFDFGFYGIEIDCDDKYLKGFVVHKLDEFIDHMKEFEVDGKVSLQQLLNHCEEFDEIEFNKFIDKLKSINLIHEVEKESIKLDECVESCKELFLLK